MIRLPFLFSLVLFAVECGNKKSAPEKPLQIEIARVMEGKSDSLKVFFDIPGS